MELDAVFEFNNADKFEICNCSSNKKVCNNEIILKFDNSN